MHRRLWRRDAGRALRSCVAFVAIFCVYVQLLAVAACPVRAGGVEPTGLVICHAQGKSADGPIGGGKQGRPERCPFCALHCTATAALSSTPALALRTGIAIVAFDRSPDLVVPRRRLACGASPRGPPSAV